MWQSELFWKLNWPCGLFVSGKAHYTAGLNQPECFSPMASDNANLDARRKQMLYRANHRGIKEMDIMLGGFAEARIGGLSDGELDLFEALLEESDRDLLTWFTGEVAVPTEVRNSMFEMILDFQEQRVDTENRGDREGRQNRNG